MIYSTQCSYSKTFVSYKSEMFSPPQSITAFERTVVQFSALLRNLLVSFRWFLSEIEFSSLT